MKSGSINSIDRLENITVYLSRNSEKYPDKPAMLHPRLLSFEELNREVDYYAAGLKASGIHRGTHTILLVSAGPEFFILCFALFRIGAVPVMIDPGMGTRAMARALAGSDARAFIGVPKAHLLRYLYPKDFRRIRIWIHTGGGWLPGSKPSAGLRMKEYAPEPYCRMSHDEVAAVFFTSGSTGPPKGVIYEAGMLEAMVKVLEKHFMYGPEDIDLCTFPLLGLFVTCLGSSLVIADMDPLKPASLDPEKLISNLNDHKCTQMFGSPMILNRLVRYSRNTPVKLEYLRRAISAGAPVPLETQKEFIKLTGGKADVHTPYGATEALPATDIRASELLGQSGEEAGYARGICVGYPLPGVEARIITITDEPVDTWSEDLVPPPDTVGEIVVKGPHITREYKNNDEANRLAKITGSSGDIWHRLGDVGRIDGKGRLWFYGRKKHMVRTQRRVLFTIPTEAVFNSHPGVMRSALVGIVLPAEEYCEPVICIQPEPGIRRAAYGKLRKELLGIAGSNELTEDIKHILFHRDFPVDPRHNAKIFREKLALWAGRRIH